MRDALTRFADAEIKKMAVQYANDKAEKAAKARLPPDSDGVVSCSSQDGHKRKARKAA